VDDDARGEMKEAGGPAPFLFDYLLIVTASKYGTLSGERQKPDT
jgi:hypothetical protein